MHFAAKMATFRRVARRALHHFLALVIAVSTLSAISVVSPQSASANAFASPNSEFAFDFNDTSSNTVVKTSNNSGPIPATTDFSIETWVNVDAYTDSWQSLFVQDQGESDGQGVARFYLGFPRVTNTLHIGIASEYQDLNYAIPLNTWTHVAMTIQRVGSNLTTKTYINGVLLAGSTKTNWTNHSISNAKGFAVGTATDGGYELDGKLDQVKVWNGVLTESDIQTSMFAYSTESISSSTLRAHYDFNEGSGTTITDRTGNSQNMTATLGSSSFWSINTDLVTEYESSSITSNSSFVTDEKGFSRGHRRNQDGTTNTTYGSKNSTTPIRLSQPATNKEVLITETSFRTPFTTNNSTRSMSLFAWVRPTSDNHTLFEELNISTLASAPTWAATLIDMVDGRYVFRIWNCQSQTAPNTTSLNQWHHVGITYDGSTMRGFIDGRQVVSQSGCTRSFPPGIVHYAVGSNFGTDQNPNGQFEGGLDLSGLQIYKSAVPPFNVARLSSVSTITFKSNYSGGPADITQTIANGTTTNLSTNSFTRDGYRFNGWDSLTGGGGNTWTNGEAVSLQGDITLFAKWVQLTVPGSPTSVTATAGNVQAGVSWTAPASDGGSAITGYSVTSSPLVSAPAGCTNTASTTCTFTGLTNGTSYTFTVVATNTIGSSSASTASTAITPRTTPGAPTALAATVGNTQVALTWTAPSSDGGSAITDYLVQFSTDGTNFTTFADGTSTTASATVTGLTNGTAYTFRVSTTNAAGTGTASSTVTGTPRTAPGAPTALAATVGNTQVALTWTAPTNTGGSAITDYLVEFSTDGTNFTTFADGTSTTASATVTGLTNGTAYTFRVSTINAAGTGTGATISPTALASCSPAANDTTTVPGYTLVKIIGTTNTINCHWSIPSGVTAIEILAVGGGGGAGFGGQGGGGGGGQVLESNQRITVSPNDPIRVSVGRGGTGGWAAAESSWTFGENGVNTVVEVNGTTITATGGGGGGGGGNPLSSNDRYTGANGGSGGGGALSADPGLKGGTTVAGFRSYESDSTKRTSGNGGAGGAGAGGTNSDTTGGIGVTIWGQSVAGGGGGWASGTGATSFGGGSAKGGVNDGNYGNNGTSGTGGGGGGGANGGSGLVVIRYGITYSITYNANSSTSGSVPASGSYTTGGSTYAIASNSGSLERTGFVFAGWNTASGGGGTNYSAGATYSTSANLVLYAKWNSVNADLSGLTISSGTLSPVFVSSTVDYTASVVNSVQTGFTVTPTVAQANATTIQYLGATGTTAFTGALSVGTNVIRTVVTAQDGTTTKTYTITVTRLATAVTPTISSQPSSISKTAGQSVTFSVTASASDSGNLSYQWKKGGTDISGATSSNYTINPTATGDAGNYTVVVTNSINSTTATATSSTAVLTMSSALTITTPTTGLSGTYNSAYSLTVSASGGSGTKTFAATGSLPTGVSISSAGVISGTPSIAGDFVLTVTATDANSATATTSSFTIVIAKGASTVLLSGPTYTYTGSPQGPDSVTKSGSTGAVTYAYAGRGSTSYTSSSTKPTNVGTYTVTATVATDSNFASVSATANFEILSASLVITPTISASSMVYGTAVGSLPTVSHTKNPDVSLSTNPTCSLYLASDTGFVTAQTLSSTLAVGSYVVRCAGAVQANYTITYGTNPTFSVTKANQTALSLPVLSASSKTFPFSQTSLSVTSVTGGDGNGALSISSVTNGTATGCSLSGSTLTATSSGTCTLTITKAASANFEVATTTATFTFNQATQSVSITSTAPTAAKVAGSTYALTATGGASGNAVTFTSTTTSVCTVATATVSFVAVGTCSIAANQASTTNYSAATEATQSFSVGKGDPALSSFANVNKVIGDSAFTLTAPTVASSLAGAFTYASGTVGTATISTATVTIVAAGTSVITATFTPTDTTNYNTATITMTLTVNNIYTLTYSYNSATGGNATVSDQFTQGGTAITLPTPSRTGYGFDGWYEASNLSGTKLSSTYSPTQSRTIYAKWIPNTQTITYAAGTGGSGSAPTTPTSVNYGATFATPANTFTQIGYTFSGWSDGTNSYAVGTTYPQTGSVSGNVTLTATWTIVSCSPTSIISGGFKIFTFTAGEPCYWSVPSNSSAVDVLVVGGGGGGAGNKTPRTYDGAGAGGGGGAYSATSVSVSGNVLIGVGTGGAGGTSSANSAGNMGQQGSTSNFGTITAGGGGGGGCDTATGDNVACADTTRNGQSGTAGGGGGGSTNYYRAYNWGIGGTGSAVTIGGVTYPAQNGFRGGYYNDGGSSATSTAGPGGGARSAANRNTPGSGLVSTFSGTSAEYGKGGSSFGVASWTFRSSTLGYGTGGDGAYHASAATNGANGADGVVIVRFAVPSITYAAGTGGGGTAPTSPSAVDFGATFTTPSNTFTRSGFTFAGWSDGTNVFQAGATYPTTGSVSANVTLTATWTADTNAVVFNNNTGSGTMSNQNIVSSTATSLTSNTFTKTGYTFAGWNTNANGTSGTNYTDGQSVTITAGMTLYAKWSANALTITYDSKSGTAVSNGTVNTGASISTAPTAPTRAGYTFGGWSATDGGTAVTFAYAHGQTANFTLYAIWTANSLTVTYNSKGGTSVASGSINTGASISSAPTPPTRAGYTFAGWSATDGGSAVSFTGGYAHGQTANFTLFALWTADSLTVTYNSKGGTSVTSGSVNTGASISSAPTAPTRSGYTLSGWSATDGGSVISFAYAHGQTASFTLYAIWAANALTVTYDSQGGSAVSNGIVNTAASIQSAPTTPTRSGFYFLGWSATSAGVTVTFPYAHGQTDGFTLYAIWTIAVETTGLRINLDASNRDSLATSSRVWRSIAPGRTNVSTSSSASDTTNVTFTTNSTPGFITFPTGLDGLKMFTAQLNGGASIVSTSGVTVETWIKLADNYAPSSTVQRIATHWFDSASGAETNDSKDWNFRIVNGSLSLLHSDGPTGRTVTSAVVLNQKFAGQWVHVGFTWGSAGAVRFYLNGAPVGAEIAGLARGASRTVTTAQVTIGTAPGGLIGSISKLRVYEGALTSSQILSNYDNEFDFFGLKKITFNANHGSGTPATSTQWVASNTSMTLDSNTFTRTGYTFAGWTAAADGTGTSYTDGQSVSISSPLTVYAKWTADGNVVSFNNNSGSGTMSNQSIVSGTATAIAANSFTRTGYTFAGWNTASNGSGISYTDGQSVTITAGMTLFARWTGTTNTITYDSKSGSSVANGSFVTGGSIASAPTAPTRAGYSLTGWSLTDGGSVITYPYSPVATSGITLYAIWAAISCSPTSSTAGGYTIYTFTTAGTCFWTVPAGVTDVEILAVAGGGGGGYSYDNSGAGGGAGGQLKTGTATLSTTLEVTVGAGGAAGISTSQRGGTGANSVVSTITALGGTGGCASRATTCSNSAQATSSAAANGGVGGAGGASGRGGGGSNTNGSTTSSTTGGVGTASSFSGTSVTYGVGGSGGTARGGLTNIAGTAGSANTGNGGNGASAKAASGDVNGGAGGSGLVIVRVASALTVTFDSQSGSDVAAGSTVTGGSIATAPTDPTRTNYTFLGWFTATTGGSAISFPYAHGQTANFTLYARWNLNTYAITFNKNSGDATGSMGNQSFTHGVAFNLNANLYSRPNYVFYRWATAADGTGTTYNNLAQVTLTAATTLYAQWTPNTYVVTYSYNGGNGGDSTATSSFTTAGTAITLPVPTRTGFTFAGWHSDAALTTLIGSNNGSGTYSPTGATLSLNAYAKWEAVNYTFTYNANSAGSGTVPTETSKQITQTATVKANTGSLERAGYTFSGWNTASNGTGTTYLSGSLFTVESANVILYAKWTANTYTITYNANGGTGNAQRSSANVTSDNFTTGGSPVVLPDAGTLTREGYNFGGWNTSAAGTGTDYAATNTYTTVSNVIFYAKWNPITYTITYNGNSSDGGTAPTNGGYTTGQASPYSVLANSYTKTSSIFGGWNTAADRTGTNYSPGASITTLANIVLYAIWIPQFTLHYAINGGTVTSGSLPADALLTQNTSVSVFSSVGRTGYTFDGWTNGASTIAPGGSFNILQNSVLTAKWTAINYTVSYNSDGGTTPPSSITRQIGQSYTIGNASSKPGHDFLGWKTGTTVVGAGASIVMGSSDVTYTAQWAAQIYQISYDWNGGRGTAVADVNYTFGTTAITLPLVGDRIRDGYTFAGWSESLGGSALSATYIPSQSRTLYARWDVGSFTITYNLSGGTLATTTVAVPNTTSTVLPLPTRANFVFDGWHTATVGGSSVGSNGASFTPTSSQTVYARWIQASLFGITNSLTRIGSVTTVANVANTFSGANSNSSVAVSIPENALPAGTTINFDMVGNSSRATGLLPNVNYLISIAISWITGDGLVPDTAANKPISVTISNATIKAGATAYAIVNNVSTLLGTASQDGTITIALTSDPEVVIAAVKPGAPTNVAATSNGNQQSVISWSPPSSNGGSAITGYTVTASPGAGTCTTSTTSCTISSLTNGTAYTFTVTATNAVGTSVASTSASATTAALYAVTFDAKSGTTVTSGSFLTASTVSEPTAPTRTGYSFAGWSATDGGSAVTFPYAPGVTTAITLYARWDALDNAVTFDSKSGSDVTASVFSSGGTVAEPTAPTRAGYTFAGWSATDGGTAVVFPYAPGVVTDITLYAKWTVVSQSVSGGGGGSSTPAPSVPSTPVKSNVTVVAPVTVVGDQDAKVIAVDIAIPTPGSNTKPPAFKVDKASEKFIAEVKVVEGKLVLTPETGFSGKKTVTVTITENGADRIVQIPLTVLPEAVTKPVLTPTASNRSLIRWTESPNADGYTVLLNGKRVCTTTALSCSVKTILGPDANIEIVSNGGDRTVSQRVDAEFRQNVPVAITRLVSATITKATLTRVDTKALDKVVGLIKNQGFGTVVISEITTTSKTKALAAARIESIKKYITSKIGTLEVEFEITPVKSRTYFNNISVKG
jgi:uncharacterized repeat protein (TIGR02543 family)